MFTQTKTLTRKYFAGYQGLSSSCWQGIGLGFFESIVANVFYYLSFYFVHDLKMSIALAGMIISCYGIGAIFGGIVGGKFADRFGSQVISGLSLVLQGCGYLILLTLSSSYSLMLDLFLIGVATYAFLTTNYLNVLTECHTEHQRLQSISILAASANLGMGLSGLFMGSLITFGFNQIFIGSGVLLILSACYQLIISTNSKNNEKIDTKITDISVSTNHNTITLAIVLGCVLFVGAIVAQLNTTYTIYLQSKFPILDIKAASLLFALNSFLVVLLQAPLTHACRQFNKLAFVGLGSFLIGAGMYTLTIGHAYSMAILACVIYTLGEIFFFSAAQLICYQAGAAKKKGQSLGLYRTTYACSRVIGPIGGGCIYHSYGGDMVWYLSGIIGLIAMAVCWCYQIEHFKPRC